MYNGEHKENWLPRPVTVTMGWSDSVAISKAMHGRELFCPPLLGEKDVLKEVRSRTVLRCPFGWYIHDLFMLEAGKRKVIWMYNNV